MTDGHDNGHDAPVTGIAARLGRSATDLSERTNQVGALVWLKRAIIMPIGERWLVISLAAGLAGPRLALALLFTSGTVAALYTTTGRLLRSAASATGARQGASELKALSDLGGLGDLVADARFVGRFAWLAPAASRALEYCAVLLAGAVVAPNWLTLSFAYVFVLSLWHYDAVYRLRFTGQAPPRLAQRLALGAAARSAIVLSAAVAGSVALAVALLGMGLLVLAVTMTDSTLAWRRWLAARTSGFSVPRFRVVSAS